MSAETIVFILSSDRSGSTWVGYVLGSMPGCGFVGELWRAWSEHYRVPCPWCYGNGIADCAVLGGVEQHEPSEAYALILRRLQKRLLVDSSKRVAWAQQVLTKHLGLRAHLIHLIRDPRGWYASESRRRQSNREDMIKHWLDENAEIRKFVLHSGIPAATVFYENLASHPEAEFKRLCEEIGCTYAPSGLRYWENIHHAFAANGASSALLRDLPDTAGFKHFVTGDDDYYENRNRKLFVDERWRQQLSEADERAIRQDSQVAAFLALYGRVLTADAVPRAATAG